MARISQRKEGEGVGGQSGGGAGQGGARNESAVSRQDGMGDEPGGDEMLQDASRAADWHLQQLQNVHMYARAIMMSLKGGDLEVLDAATDSLPAMPPSSIPSFFSASSLLLAAPPGPRLSSLPAPLLLLC